MPDDDGSSLRPDVLLVEDDQDGADLFRRALEADGRRVRVELARDGQQALDFFFLPNGGNRLLAASLPRLVVLDLKLPLVDGFEVLRRLKAGDPTRAIPVVVLTSSAEWRDISASYELGANSYVVKPVAFDRYREAVRAVVHYWLDVNEAP